MPVHLDLPDTRISSPSFPVVGWIAGEAEGPAVSLTVNGRSIAYTLQDFPAVRQALQPYGYVMGVVATADLIDCPGEDDLEIALSFGGDRTSRRVPVDTRSRRLARRDAALRETHRQWCRRHLRCPACRAAATATAGDDLSCTRCGVAFAQATRALNLISPELRIASNIVATDNVSSNPYAPAARSLIGRTIRKGGWVLDCGAGSRPRRLRNVVNVDVVDYRSTDVLAVGEALPFHDNAFDAVLSLAVLEHVRDPFACARELVRVAKPGAPILVDAPGLAPLHGYPHHYYNMTGQGLRNLFQGHASVVESYVPLHGHPIWALQWMIAAYLDGLPEGIREDFARKTLSDFRAAPQPADFSQPGIAALSETARQALASIHTVVVTKR